MLRRCKEDNNCLTNQRLNGTITHEYIIDERQGGQIFELAE